MFSNRLNSVAVVLAFALLAAPALAEDEEELKDPAPEHAVNTKAQSVDAEPMPEPAPAPVFKYVGHNVSHKFHSLRCPYGRIIHRTHKTEFPYRKDAVAAGFKPCKYCLPQVWTRVEAKIFL